MAPLSGEENSLFLSLLIHNPPNVKLNLIEWTSIDHHSLLVVIAGHLECLINGCLIAILTAFVLHKKICDGEKIDTGTYHNIIWDGIISIL